MSADNFRQSLSRARRDLYQFMHGQCGLVNPNNPCRCAKKTRGFIEAGHVDPDHLQFVPSHLRRITEAAEGVTRTIEILSMNSTRRSSANNLFSNPKIRSAG
jgi:hypothetical protein